MMNRKWTFNKNSTFAIAAILIVMAWQPTAAQDSEVNSIFKRGSEIKGFGAVEMKFSPVVDDTGFLVGASGGLHVNKFFIVGVGAYGVATKTDILSADNTTDLRVYTGYGGVIIGFTLFPRSVVHLSFPILIGAGNVDVVDPVFFTAIDSEFTIERSTFFVAEPNALLEVNVTPFFRLGLGASFRYIDGMTLNNLRNGELTDLSGNISLKFGGY